MVGMSLDYLVKNLYDMIYPVGICIDFDTETVDPNTAFPGTTWVRITDGAYVVASGVSAGTIAGNNSFTIGVANLPSHSHSMAHTHTINHNHGTIDSDTQGAHQHSVSGTTGGGGDHSHTRGSMEISGKLGTFRGEPVGKYAIASGAFSLEPRIGDTSYTGQWGDYGQMSVFTASKTWTGSTSSSGTHTHSFSATTNLVGSHSHKVGIPNYNGTSGASSAANTGSVGSGAAITFTPTFHRYARWKRTA